MATTGIEALFFLKKIQIYLSTKGDKPGIVSEAKIYFIWLKYVG